jgi:radical SAM protein with 4Fe4S-binding SPASM domain
MAGNGSSFKRRAWAYLANGLYRIRSDWAVPKSLGICLSDKCNIRCVYCMREQYRPPKAMVTLEQVKTLVGRMPYLEGVCIMGLCEPFLNPETPNILSYLKDEAGLTISFTTNGMVELDDDKLDALLRVDDFVFSMDSADPETFKFLRGGADLEKVKANLDRLLAFKRERGLGKMQNPPIHINGVITSRNYDQIPDLIKMLEPMADELTYLMVDPVTRPDYQKFEEPLMVHRELFESRIHEYRALAKASPLQVVGFDYMFEPSSQWSGCHLSWDGMFIHPNGDAYYCYDYEYIVGNVFEKSPLAVWNSKKAREFRRSLKSEKPPLDQCRTCNFARSGWQTGGTYDVGKEDVLT